MTSCRIDRNNVIFFYSKLMFYSITIRFTSLRLRVMWRTEQIINVHKITWASAVVLSDHVGFGLGIVFISSGIVSSSLPLLLPRVWLVLVMFLIPDSGLVF